MEVTDFKTINELDEENSRLKKMFANLSLQNEAL